MSAISKLQALLESPTDNSDFTKGFNMGLATAMALIQNDTDVIEKLTLRVDSIENVLNRKPVKMDMVDVYDMCLNGWVYINGVKYKV